MTIFMRSRLRLLLNTRNLQTQYQTQLFFQWCGSQTAWWLQLSLSATSPGPWRRVSCKAYLPTSWGMWHSHDGYRLTHYDWWGPSVVPITMVDFAVAEPNQAIQLGELWFGCWVHSWSWCWNGVINLDIDYGPSIGPLYISQIDSFWEPHKRWMLIATKFCSTRIIHFKYGKWTKVEEAGCSISQCTDLTVQRAQSSNVRVAILGRNGNGGTHTHTCTEMQLWNTRYTYYMAIGIFLKKTVLADPIVK